VLSYARQRLRASFPTSPIAPFTLPIASVALAVTESPVCRDCAPAVRTSVSVVLRLRIALHYFRAQSSVDQRSARSCEDYERYLRVQLADLLERCVSFAPLLHSSRKPWGSLAAWSAGRSELRSWRFRMKVQLDEQLTGDSSLLELRPHSPVPPVSVWPFPPRARCHKFNSVRINSTMTGRCTSTFWDRSPP